MSTPTEGNILDTLSSPDLTAIPDTPTTPKTKKKPIPKPKVKPESKPVEISKAVEAEVIKRGNNHPTNVGRPLKFYSVEELQEKIDEYFDYCDNRSKTMYVKELGDNVTISDPAPYTMSGLAHALGTNRQTILNYSKKEEYFYTIQSAKARVERDLDERMNDKTTFTPGLIFNLKNNFGWRDETEQTHSFKQMPKPIIDIGLQPPKEDEDES